MSECVVRMEMPENYCEMAVEIKGVGDWCPIMAGVCDYNSTKKMPDWCPIICALPEGYGRLIDADALRTDHFVTSTTTNTPLHRYVSMEQIEAAPTIVPAERSEP